MPVKLFAAALAVVLMLAFLLPLVFKLKEVSLAVIAALGVTMMLADLWQSLQSKDE